MGHCWLRDGSAACPFRIRCPYETGTDRSGHSEPRLAAESKRGPGDADDCDWLDEVGELEDAHRCWRRSQQHKVGCATLIVAPRFDQDRCSGRAEERDLSKVEEHRPRAIRKATLNGSQQFGSGLDVDLRPYPDQDKAIRTPEKRGTPIVVKANRSIIPR
jgi:hypothetical protein